MHDESTFSPPEGFSVDQLTRAINTSGYPLQSKVADVIAQASTDRGSRFRVQEEWPYLDVRTGQLRAMDLLAQRILWDPESEHDLKVRPFLTLVVECKRSSAPYVFFEARNALATRFPVIAGLRNDEMQVDWMGRTQGRDILAVLSMHSHPFLAAPAVASVSFTKVVRKGDGAELTGSEPFLSLVEPMLSATTYLVKESRPSDGQHLVDASMVVPVAVVDAPMILATFDAGDLSLEDVDRVRVIRADVGSEPVHTGWAPATALDVVHFDHLADYLATDLFPFAELFGERCVRIHERLDEGRAAIADTVDYPLERDLFDAIVKGRDD